jgi:hypothetical protein
MFDVSSRLKEAAVVVIELFERAVFRVAMLASVRPATVP